MEDIRNMRQDSVTEKLVIYSKDSNHNVSFLARLALVLICKTLYNQLIMIHFGVLPYIESLHLVSTSTDDEEMKQETKWIAKFAKDSYFLALEGVVNSLIIMTMERLERKNKGVVYRNCLRALAYLYMNGMCGEEMYKADYLELIASHAKRAMKKSVK